MKKTLIALFALATMAQAMEQTTYDSLLSSAEGWTSGSRLNRPTYVVNTETQSLTLDNSNWSQAHTECTLPHIVGATEDIALNFSVTMHCYTSSAAYSVALVGLTQTIAIGTNYQQKFFYGTSDNTTANAYTFNPNDYFADHKNAIVTGTQMTTTLAANADYVISALSSYNAETKTYSLTLKLNEETVVINDLDSLNVQKLVFMGDGESVAHNVAFSSLSISGATPEPATATLSLLALAGLAARRRRH